MRGKSQEDFKFPAVNWLPSALSLQVTITSLWRPRLLHWETHALPLPWGKGWLLLRRIRLSTSQLFAKHYNKI